MHIGGDQVGEVCRTFGPDENPAAALVPVPVLVPVLVRDPVPPAWVGMGFLSPSGSPSEASIAWIAARVSTKSRMMCW